MREGSARTVKKGNTEATMAAEPTAAITTINKTAPAKRRSFGLRSDHALLNVLTLFDIIDVFLTKLTDTLVVLNSPTH